MSSSGNEGPQHQILSWHGFFMGTAYLAGMRSKDPDTQVGACIVNKSMKIMGIGYDGMPIMCKDENFSWKSELSLKNELAIRMEVDEEDVFSANETKNLYVIHAEINAIINTNRNDIRDSAMYVVQYPCNHCAKAIIQSGIKEVFYCVDRHDETSNKATKKMFKAAGIDTKKLEFEEEKIVIGFSN